MTKTILRKSRNLNKKAINPRRNSRESASTVVKLVISPRIVVPLRKVEPNKECDDLCVMFSEYNLMGNPRKWWMDPGATRHVCANKELFSSFAPAQVEEMIYMANSATAKVEGTGKVGLKMTSGKVFTLNNVLYVPDLHRNLISVSLLDKNGFKCVTISGKNIISKGEVDISDINATKRMLESKFDMKDLGVPDVILGLNVWKSPMLGRSESRFKENVSKGLFSKLL
ncbi:hypothetical protein CQW23_03625 [Capsicum baccatum]|uniref:Retrovirus-related Pol polyprotein from transposon TNT 1-94-like beta-barrel domain-containing protein n=1 Tax=Capsicum baccatum TaxID=33114 RepID=A0A2G2XCG1_CAPBA|nr:hypothetical protein CQW23_03625 [Capsicum baccatum]